LLANLNTLSSEGSWLIRCVSQHIDETTLSWTVWTPYICFSETVLARYSVVKMAAYQLSG